MKILGASVICASLLALAATPGMGQDDPEPQPIGNTWSVSYPAPRHGERRGSHQILWSLAPAEHEYLSPSQTAHVWGDRYGLYAIRLSRGIGHEGTDRAYIIDVDGQGYGFTLAQGAWRPDPGVGSALQSSGDLYVLEAGPPGALDLHGLWTYRFYQGAQAQHGHLASITDPFGNTSNVSPPDFGQSRITVVDPTGRTTYLYFSASPGPYDEVIFTRSELDPLGDAYGIVQGRALLPPLTAGARWGSDLYEVAPPIDAEMLVGYSFGGLEPDSATVSWGPSRVDYTFELNPSQNMTSSASVRIGSLQPRTLSYGLFYDFNSVPHMVGINCDYGTGSVSTHSLFVAQPISGGPQDAIAIFQTKPGMNLFEAEAPSGIQMEINALGFPTSITVQSGQGDLEAELTWTDDGNLALLRDYRGKDWSIQWDNHRPVRETDPTGFFLSYGYGGDWFNGSGTNPLNARSSIADRAGNTWRLNYLSDGRLAEVWEPGATAPSRRFFHEQGSAFGWLSRFRDASGRITDYPEYTEFGLPSRVHMYPLDNPATPDVIEGGTQGMLELSIERNLLGNPTAITYSDGATVSIQYEDAFPVGITDERGRQFYFDYNPPDTGESGLLHRVRAPAQNWGARPTPNVSRSHMALTLPAICPVSKGATVSARPFPTVRKASLLT